jgi:hypothetical protein
MHAQRPEVQIGEMVTEMIVTDEGDALPRREAQRLLQMAVRLVREQIAHDERARRERDISCGARDLLEG